MTVSAKSSQLPETGVFQIIGTPQVRFRNKFGAKERLNGEVVAENDEIIYKTYNSTSRSMEKANIDPNSIDLEYIVPVKFPKATLITKIWIPERDRNGDETHRDMAVEEARIKLNKTAFGNLSAAIILDIALSGATQFSMDGFIISYKNKDASFEKNGETVSYKQTTFKRAGSSDKVQFSTQGASDQITEDDLPF